MSKQTSLALGITSLILAIVGMVLLFFSAFIYILIISLIICILSIIFGAVAFFSKNRNYIGLAGFIIGLIALILTILVGIALAVYTSVSLEVGDDSYDFMNTPKIAWIVDSSDFELTITKSSDSASYAENFYTPNLVFRKNNVDYYVGIDMYITTRETANTNVIKAGDEIYGFSEGQYTVVWEPTNEVFGIFNFY